MKDKIVRNGNSSIFKSLVHRLAHLGVIVLSSVVLFAPLFIINK